MRRLKSVEIRIIIKDTCRETNRRGSNPNTKQMNKPTLHTHEDVALSTIIELMHKLPAYREDAHQLQRLKAKIKSLMHDLHMQDNGMPDNTIKIKSVHAALENILESVGTSATRLSL